MFKTKAEFKKDFTNRVLERYGCEVSQCTNGELFEVLGGMVRDYAFTELKDTKDYIAEHKSKELVYFSMEFLMGRLLTNNLANLGFYKMAKDGLKDLGVDINALEDEESDAGLGNGGLGRLAACFLDSIASLGYPGHGQTIRYQYGFFKQKIWDNQQVEVPDQWLGKNFVWEVRKPDEAIDIQFYGNAEYYTDENGHYHMKTSNSVHVKAVPYDVPVIGYKNNVVNTLRLWGAEPSEEHLPWDRDFNDYRFFCEEICQRLYPDDSNEHGKILRLRQQYFLVSAGMQSVIKEHKKHYGTLKNFAEKHVFQLNDTHPILSIPETMRILMDEEGFGWEDAWDIVNHCMAYTNHTIMAEALEKWPVNYVSNLLPRIYMIIEEIDRRFVNTLRQQGYSEDFIYRVRIIKDGMIHMTNLGIHAVFSVNGVAKLHTEICKNDTFKDLYTIYPEKFNNKTNGVTHRRWLVNCNPSLVDYITSLLGSDEWIKHPDELEKLMVYIDDEKVLKQIMKIKKENKKRLAEYIKVHNHIDVDVDSIFDTQIKRLHAYKRQLMNCFKIMYYYKRLKLDPTFNKMTPHTYIFGAKAAPSYTFAKKVIELINCISRVVNNDPAVNKYMKVVFIENYEVSSAEVIIPGTDVSEQISTAGKEASGTSNMKFMLNGAITLGTLDGANVEINKLVGDDNSVIFGFKTEELDELRKRGSYKAWDIYNSDYWAKVVIDSLMDRTWHPNQEEFRMIFDEIMWRNDEYFNLLDLDSYVNASEEIDRRYKNKLSWARSCLINIAKAGYFSSDRTIDQYVDDIWELEKIKYPEDK